MDLLNEAETAFCPSNEPGGEVLMMFSQLAVCDFRMICNGNILVVHFLSQIPNGAAGHYFLALFTG